MAYFSYHAIDQAGNERTGTIMADNKSAAIKKIKQLHYYPTKIFPIDKDYSFSPASADVPPKKMFRLFHRKVKVRDIAMFIRDLSVLIDAGMPIVRALTIMHLQILSPVMQETIHSIRTDVENGQGLSESLKKYPRYFPDLYINMIKAGELGGGQLLSEVLKRLSDLCENTERLNARIKSALTYPAIVLAFAMLVVVTLVTFILPKFFIIYEDLDLTLPYITGILFNITWFLKEKWYFFLAGMLILFVFIALALKKPRVHFLWDKHKLNLPLFGDIFKKVSISRFSRTFGTLLNSGVPILQALTIVKDATGNLSMAQAIESVKNSIREGESIASPLSHFSVFPPLVTNMIAIGEETGNVGTMLIKIADKYDEEVETILLQLTALLEPFLILFLGIIVGFIIIALFMPLVSLMQGISA
jgi:type IV pilus assembly protein PilC